MKHFSTSRTLRFFCVFSLLAGLCLAGLSGCDGFALPPIPVSITIATGAEVIAANQNDDTVDVPLTVFCDLFSEESLNELITAFGGAEIAALVNISGVEMESVEVVALQDTNFDEFTTASLDMTLIAPGSNPIDLGMVTDPTGLGASFEFVQDPPFDLLNDLADDECGVPALHLKGDNTPTEDIQFNVIAHVLVYTQISF